MSEHKECVAMILAGGQGSRLGVLTRNSAKPAVPFGGKYRVIDFPLSNCANSGIDVVGVLTQYEPLELNTYIGTGSPWDLDVNGGGVFVLPPYTQAGDVGRWFEGTADAIYQNIKFVDGYYPDYIVVLSGDHIYKMDYAAMMRFHKNHEADATIAVMPVPMEEASRFGILDTAADSTTVTAFVEKPEDPPTNLASMGIYVFTWPVVRQYLIDDAANADSSHDFGKDIIPALLDTGQKLSAYRFEGYWRDVGTIDSLWEGNMDLLNEVPSLDMGDNSWHIYTRSPNLPAALIGPDSRLDTCQVAEGCDVRGNVEHSILFQGVQVAEGAVVKDSVILGGTRVGPGAVVARSVVAQNVNIAADAVVGGEGELVVIGAGAQIGTGAQVEPGASIEPDAIFNALEETNEEGEE